MFQVRVRTSSSRARTRYPPAEAVIVSNVSLSSFSMFFGSFSTAGASLPANIWRPIAAGAETTDAFQTAPTVTSSRWDRSLRRSAARSGVSSGTRSIAIQTCTWYGVNSQTEAADSAAAGATAASVARTTAAKTESAVRLLAPAATPDAQGRM